jgi:membrane fusion protein (multidrug efflux system)
VPVPFARTLRALAAERTALPGAVAVGSTLLLGAWSLWFVLARVGVYVVTPEARVEAAAAAAPVATQVGGMVTAVSMEMGAPVHAGDVLVELDATVEQKRLEEEIARQDALNSELTALRSQVETARSLLGAAQARALAASEEGNARFVEADDAAQLAEEQARRLEQVATGVSAIEVLEAQATARQKRAAADALRSQIRREDWDQRGLTGDRLADLAELQRQVATTSGELGTTAAAVARLGGEVERRHIRAPVDGVLGEGRALRPGTVLEEGETIATIVPTGDLRIVASFSPADALGRIHVGQPARMRLDGFPWTEYGAVPAVVTAVATESRDGRVRVELEPGASDRIALSHGLPGSVEVELERVSPATLLLRTAGELLDSAR